MGAMQRSVTFSFTVADYGKWSKEHLEEFESQADTGFNSYDDWVVDQISEIMRTAGDDFMENNNDLFSFVGLI